MPGARTKQSSIIETDDTAMAGDAVNVRLRFKEPLTWRAGKAIPVADLLKRLQTLSKELQSLEQEEVDRDTLIGPCKELASHNLLQHKDRGVKAWTACCIVDMFRLCAPDAPYTIPQTKDIFTLIVHTIIPSLADPSSPYNQQHLFVLKSLTEVKSIVLLTDLPTASELLHHLFESCFDILSGPSKSETGEELSKNVEHHMTSLLGVLLDEAQALPQQVVDVILAQFLRADPRSLAASGNKSKKGTTVADDKQTTLLLKEAPPAYNMAKNVCNSAPEKMAQYVLQYFSQVLVQATDAKEANSRRADDDGEDGTRDLTDADLLESRKAHNMIRELWRSCPSVLQNVIPHLESEIMQEDVQLRLLGTETLGDMISGIGAAGPPPAVELNPSAYPSQSVSSASERAQAYNFLTTPSSPVSFGAKYPQTYQAYLSRRKDKSPLIRAAWTTGIGRILITSAGNVGLDQENESQLLQYLADMLVDVDERVRLSAVKVLELFSFDDVVQKVGSKGGVLDEKSILSNLSDRVKDRRPLVRNEALKLLGKLWGVASGAIAEGNEQVTRLLGPAASKILETYYINDVELTALADRVLFESLLPLDFPPLKPRAAQHSGSRSQRATDLQNESQHQEQSFTELDIDRIRAERELLLIRDLESKAKFVLFRKGNVIQNARLVEAFLKQCEEYNGGVVEKSKDAKDIKDKLEKFIDYFRRTFPDPTHAAEDLWKFAKMHDRRGYQLMRFCMNPESDYQKVRKANREFIKRLESASGSTKSLVEIMTVLLYRVSVLLFNRSHVPAIIEFSRNDERGLGAVAHEVLKEISNSVPAVLQAHTEDLCQALVNEAPSSKRTSAQGAVADLRACAGFAKKFPKDFSKDRKFLDAMKAYVLYGHPAESAKYAVSIVMADPAKQKMHTKDLLSACMKNFSYGAEHFLPRLAALSQLMLVGASDQVDEVYDTLSDIAISKVLLHFGDEVETDLEWTDAPDEHCLAKTWALRLLVNRLRSYSADESIDEVAAPIYEFLNGLIKSGGQLPSKQQFPKATQSRLRLLAAQLMLKLCCSKQFNALLTPEAFGHLATVAQDPLEPVRAGFVRKVMKYLTQNKLPHRFYSILFLLAFEPSKGIREDCVNFLRARSATFAKQNNTTMEAMLARVISLLAHHPDFSTDAENLKDFAQYILFYLKCVAKDENLSLIYHIAQCVKSVRDGIDPTPAGLSEISPGSRNLYVLSDLAQTIIRRYEEQQGWSLQSYPTRFKMPAGLFASLPSHAVAQEIANKTFLSEEVADAMEDIVKEALRTKKRKFDGGNRASTKRHRTSAEAGRSKSKAGSGKNALKTPRGRAARDGADRSSTAPSSATRRSSRAQKQTNYFELSSSADEAEAEEEEDEAEVESGAEQEAPAAPSSPEQAAPVKARPIRSRGGGLNGVASSASPRADRPSAAKKVAPSPRTAKEALRASRAKKQERDIMSVPSDED